MTTKFKNNKINTNKSKSHNRKNEKGEHKYDKRRNPWRCKRERERERERLYKPQKINLRIKQNNLKTIFCGIVYRVKNKGHPLIN